MANLQAKQGPIISVVVPLYNHEKYIEAALRSVLNQTTQDFEIIIVNDGSTDGSEEVVKGIHDERIRYYHQENQGAHAAINRGIQLARGEFISILNSDDEYDPARFEECLNVLGSDPSVAAVFSHVEFIDGEGKFIKYLRGAEENWANHNPETSFKGEENILLDLLAGNFLTTTSNLFCRKSVFQEIGFFQNLRYAHDYEFFLRLVYHRKSSIIDRPLVKYRIHEANAIKENEPVTTFEVGLVLANFFLQNSFENMLQTRFNTSTSYDMLMRLFNSINTLKADRMVMILLLYSMQHAGFKSEFMKVLAEDSKNPFRRVCVESFNAHINLWKDSQEAWARWQEINERLISKDRELQETYSKLADMWSHAQEGWAKWEETNARLIEKEQEVREKAQEIREKADAVQFLSKEIEVLRNSKSYRIGRIVTWPIRKLRGITKVG